MRCRSIEWGLLGLCVVLLAGAAGCQLLGRGSEGGMPDLPPETSPQPTPEPPPAPSPPPAPAPVPTPPPPATGEGNVRIQLTKGQSRVTFKMSAPIHVTHAGGGGDLAPGTWSVQVSNAVKARQRFHVFTKTFKPHETAETQAYLAEWETQGYKPELVTCGREFDKAGGGKLDNRVNWVSLGRYDTEDQARAAGKKLEAKSVWAWIRPETIIAGQGSLTVQDAAGNAVLSGPAPLQFLDTKPVALCGKDTRTYTGELDVAVGPDGLLEVYEVLPLETYLYGVVPGEMPASWSIEALKAQAIAARSSVLADLDGKHSLEGFDFCAAVHCRAYLGEGGRHPNSDAAVKETDGQVIVANGRVVPGVFCSDCGGWTENNDVPWSSPPDPSLRGLSDLPPGSSVHNGPDKGNVEQWLASVSNAYCKGDKTNFRWTRTLSAAEATELVNKRYAVGTVQQIELGDRGVSGRLKWLRVIGSKDTVTIHKELPIRQTFGNLPSALFTLKTGSGSFTFVGGGNGHGVGLCQHGANGMAKAGKNYKEILDHYFTGVQIARIE
jgi:SpoIID/LytB domain protein